LTRPIDVSHGPERVRLSVHAGACHPCHDCSGSQGLSTQLLTRLPNQKVTDEATIEDLPTEVQRGAGRLTEPFPYRFDEVDPHRPRKRIPRRETGATPDGSRRETSFRESINDGIRFERVKCLSCAEAVD
jgi:hypothetical protein